MVSGGGGAGGRVGDGAGAGGGVLPGEPPERLNAIIPAVPCEVVTLNVHVAVMEPAEACVVSASEMGKMSLKSCTEKGLDTVMCEPPLPPSSTAQQKT